VREISQSEKNEIVERVKLYPYWDKRLLSFNLMRVEKLTILSGTAHFIVKKIFSIIDEQNK
tara:strand:+ start:1248 stop:1430 length:183 start_codon:yes stop_codon:yes gene_type:complete